MGKENDLLPLFCMGDYFVYCNDIKGLMAAMKCKYNPEDWNNFIDRLKTSLKNVLLHTMCVCVFIFIPIRHSVTLKKIYDCMKIVFEKMLY